jgi:hypothetical protein
MIQESTDNQGYLIVWDDLLVNEIIQTHVFELAHDSGGYVASCQDRDFRRRVLFDGSHGSLVGGHCMKESKRTRYKGDGLGTRHADTYKNVLSDRGRR